MSVAGSDCCAGAGIQADLKAFAANGVYGLTAVTSVVAETPNRVVEVLPQPAQSVACQVRTLLDAYPVAALKTGLLATSEVVEGLAQELEGTEFPVVVDPVAVATAGDSLVGAGFAEALLKFIQKRATLVTPNRSEAEVWLKKPLADVAEARAATAKLARMLGSAVLLKGGHFEGELCTDFLSLDGEIHEISFERLADCDVHGTGCTYSAAITARLAQGHDLLASVQMARSYLHQTLVHRHSWQSSNGHSLKALAHFPNNVQI